MVVAMMSDSSMDEWVFSVETMLPTIRMLPADRSTVSPASRTASGSWLSTCDTLFCTCTCAMSASTPVPKVRLMLAEPLEEVLSM